MVVLNAGVHNADLDILVKVLVIPGAQCLNYLDTPIPAIWIQLGPWRTLVVVPRIVRYGYHCFGRLCHIKLRVKNAVYHLKFFRGLPQLLISSALHFHLPHVDAVNKAGTFTPDGVDNRLPPGVVRTLVKEDQQVVGDILHFAAADFGNILHRHIFNRARVVMDVDGLRFGFTAGGLHGDRNAVVVRF